MPSNNHSSDMYIVDVIPITRASSKETLSYFTSKKILKGAIVSITIRNKKKEGVVLSCKSVRESKTSIRSSSYSIKKIDSILSKNFFSPEFIEAASDTAKYFAGTTGSVLNALAGPALKNINVKTSVKGSDVCELKRNTDIKPDFALLQANENERVSTYKSIIREEFARGFSVFFCLPEISEIEKLSDAVKKGIEEYTFVFHGGMPQKDMKSMWQKAVSSNHPVCIIGTGTFLSLPRRDFGTIILDKESSRVYKQSSRPFIDTRKFAQIYAAKTGARLIFGDIVLRPETIYKKEKGEFSELSPLKFRFLSDSENIVIDMKKTDNKEKNKIEKKPVAISDSVKKMIILTKQTNKRMFMLTARRGLFPFTICNDCGNIIKCGKCNTSAVLHKEGNKNFFMCHTCGSSKKASDKCPHCGGWRLATLGIGIEYIDDVLKKEFPEIKIFRIDRDSVKNHKKALEIRDAFYKTPGSILLGTEMAMPYLCKPIENSVVASIDSLFTIPDFRINERIFGILMKVRSKTLEKFIIQTRDPENILFSYAINGNIMNFYREEISARKMLAYPPFTTLIKITLAGKKQATIKEIENLASELSEYDPIVFPSFVSVIKGKYKMNILLKLTEGKWIDTNLLDRLRALPMQFEVRVDPDNVL